MTSGITAILDLLTKIFMRPQMKHHDANTNHGMALLTTLGKWQLNA